MSALRRAAGTVSAVVVLSGLVGAAAGCAGGSASEGGGATAASASGAGGVVQKAAAPQALGIVRGSAVGGGAARDIAHASAALHSVPAVRSAVIKTASLDLRVRHGRFGAVMDAAGTIASQFGGFVSRSSASGTHVHDGELVMRVPVRRFHPALVAVEHLGRPTDESVVGQDVTQQFVNLDARLGNLESQQRALRQLMGRARDGAGHDPRPERAAGRRAADGGDPGPADLPAKPDIHVDDLGRRPRGRPPARAAGACERSVEGGSTVTGCRHRGGQRRDRRRRPRDPDRHPRPAGRAHRPARGAWAAPLAARRRGPARTPPE